MVARFKNEGGEWLEKNFRLIGWSRFDLHKSGCLWYGDGAACYRYCQVYDAPDPGEGWRLIDPGNEDAQMGDEFLSVDGRWIEESRHNTFYEDTFYRRRITPTVIYTPFTWEDREQLRGRWVTWKHENGLMIESQIDHLNQHKDGGLWFKSHDTRWLVENAVFVDTKEPVGKKVTQ